MTVLFSSAGRRVELLDCFRRAGSELHENTRILACDAQPRLSAACCRADECFAVPRCDDPGFIPAVLELCRREKVRLLIPTIDTELLLLASHQQRFQAIGTLIAISSLKAVQIARNKLATAEFLRSRAIPCPDTIPFSGAKEIPEALRFPIILKPIEGSSSTQVHIYRDREELSRSIVPVTGYVAQQYWSGEEYTVNLFFDRERLRCAIPHCRMETRAGEVSKGVTRRVPILMSLAEKLGEALEGQAFGPLCFQAIVTADGAAAIFEINGRFGGGYPLADYAGAKFAQWLLEIALGRPCSANNNWRENVQMLRYDAAVFTDPAGPDGQRAAPQSSL